MMSSRLVAGSLVILAALTGAAEARDPIVGGAPMPPSNTIVENAGRSKEHTTLVKLVQASGLLPILSGAGPFTVFAPTNHAFDKLPPGTVDNLLKAENKPQLKTVLSYHVVEGALPTKELEEKIKAGGGKAELKTVQGETITVEKRGRGLDVTDAKGGTAHIVGSGVPQKNGVIYVIDAVLLP